MRRASAPASSNATQIAGRSLASRYADLRVEIDRQVCAIRAALADNTLAGFHTHVATLMDWRRERISRELSRVEKLSVELFLAEVALHRFEGRDETADRLLAALTAGQPLRIHTTGAVVIRMADGQLFLDLTGPEVKA